MKKQVAIASVAICLAIFGVWMGVRSYRDYQVARGELVLLVPDSISFSDPRVTLWIDTANEEGIHLTPLKDSDFLRPLFGKPKCAGIILPDSIHQEASDLLVGEIRKYVADGGALMLVYDAGVKSIQGFYSGDRSQLSDLAGVNYALYKQLGKKMIQTGELRGSIQVMNQLDIPPGKYFPFADQSVDTGNSTETRLRRYQYGSLNYPSFVTSGTYDGQVLLKSDQAIVASYHPYQKGSVLFVNLPLGYLKSNTDGLLLHSFLHYFGVEILSLPRLLAAPDGVGGLVLNWHVDSNAAISALQQLESWPLAQQGPFSIDITAGPDTYKFNDHQGFDIQNNVTSQELVREYVRRGNEIGSHGGWIHNYFAAHVETDPPVQMTPFLQLNKDAIEKITMRPVVEYAAPNGDQPEWVTQWLDSHGFVAYYFTGDSGLGPTQDYRNGQRQGHNLWAFPVSQLDRAASFEELSAEDVSFDEIEHWLELLTTFVTDREEARLLYFHPPGILPYSKEVQKWSDLTQGLAATGTFRWYTMAQLADFMNARKRVSWTLEQHDGTAVLQAHTSDRTLAHNSWSLAVARFSKPILVKGNATVLQRGDFWIVDAGEAREIELQAMILKK